MDINRSNIVFVVLCSFAMIMASCRTTNKKEYVLPAAEIDSVVRRMSDLMVHDVTNPPLVARFFGYAFLSGYEIFPEYVSGHSVVSGGSAEILSHYFGDHFEYRDSVEQDFGLPPRSFQSFRQAANEAARSRYYGGIYFMDANTNGLLQGEAIGRYILSDYFKKWHLKRQQENSFNEILIA